MRPRALVMADYAAPALTALLLCAFLAFGELGSLRHPGSEAYFGRVRDAIDALPFKVGPFVGATSDVTPAAMQLLRPNRLSQRAYTDPETHGGLTLLVVHCRDVRDMRGHYPPNCYPAHGWRREATEERTVRLGGVDCPARLYEFSQHRDTAEQRMFVLNFFVVPNRECPVVADVQGLDRETGSRRAAGLGSGQVQLVVSDRRLLAGNSDTLAGFMAAIEPIVQEISKGPTSE